MTPDGIPAEDWERIHELAVDIANATIRGDVFVEEIKTEEILSHLQELRSRHGDLPSILGTLGDYTSDELEQYDLYAQAVREAQRIRDDNNLQILLESLLELECLDHDQRVFWQAQLSALKCTKPHS